MNIRIRGSIKSSEQKAADKVQVAERTRIVFNTVFEKEAYGFNRGRVRFESRMNCCL